MVHTEFGADPIEAANYLEQLGANLCRVIFCHMDRTVEDLAVHKELCLRGIAMENHKPLTKSAYRSMWKLVERELPDTHITAHLLRHTFITRM